MKKRLIAVCVVFWSFFICSSATAKSNWSDKFRKEINNGNLKKAVYNAEKANIKTAAIVRTALQCGIEPEKILNTLKNSSSSKYHSSHTHKRGCCDKKEKRFCYKLKGRCCDTSPINPICKKFFKFCSCGGCR